MNKNICGKVRAVNRDRSCDFGRVINSEKVTKNREAIDIAPCSYNFAVVTQITAEITLYLYWNRFAWGYDEWLLYLLCPWQQLNCWISLNTVPRNIPSEPIYFTPKCFAIFYISSDNSLAFPLASMMSFMSKNCYTEPLRYMQIYQPAYNFWPPNWVQFCVS